MSGGGTGGGFVATVNGMLADPAVVQQVRQMHAAGTPLVDMVDALGLGDQMSAQLRAVVQAIPPDQVTAIRAATLEMLDRGEHDMPLDCDVTETQIDAGTQVDVVVVDESGIDTIRVRPTS